ncbi:iron-siderophore ABC transporter substrate-binding protein [Romeria aff. gracilis LEGE 07310]|uniref:Iron-siderophore ABC transporter substrate-binding protein n=1 Tax=Vasconcelosia minhoensis LEGE 07310 TaxID=915328 RepID=A0A8J7D9X8_9CYAN|nr:iron-siderophore ABC transporter substrate-binding protein [Romeria gracilis]MBE9075817.1 iron-siderophore ABC transporter substrate-binding protein [Romeria aff. gracilis LEGE 07310]
MMPSSLSKMYRLLRWLLLVVFTIGVILACTPGPSPILGPSETSSPDCRIVQHDMGETCIPMNPQRVVGIGGAGFFALDLGVEPVGIWHSELTKILGIQQQIQAIENIGDPPNLETLVALKPDLIFGWGGQEIYNQLSQIAPTVLKDWQHIGQWKEMLMYYADLLNKTKVAEQLMATYYQRIEEFRQRLGVPPNQIEVSVMRVRPEVFDLELKQSFSGTIIEDVGLRRPSAQQQDIFGLFDLSKERLADADGDVIFVWTYGYQNTVAKAAQFALTNLQTDPLWQQLNAVKNNAVYEVPGYWIGDNVKAANLVLDDLFKHLVDKK